MEFVVKWGPFFAKSSAVSFPCIPTCEGTHWKTTVLPCLLRSFIVFLASFTIWGVACLFEAVAWMAALESTRRTAFLKAIGLRSSWCSALVIAVVSHQSWFCCFQLVCNRKTVRSRFLLPLFHLFLIVICQCISSGILPGGYLLLMVASASCCSAVVGISFFFTPYNRERLVWNDWYSVGAIVGHMCSALVGISNCWRWLWTVLRGGSWVLRCCRSDVLVICNVMLIILCDTMGCLSQQPWGVCLIAW